MDDRPAHPEQDNTEAPLRSLVGLWVGLGIVALIAGFVVLHVTGVLGPEGH